MFDRNIFLARNFYSIYEYREKYLTEKESNRISF